MELINILAWTAAFFIATVGLLAGAAALLVEPLTGVVILVVSISIAQRLF